MKTIAICAACVIAACGTIAVPKVDATRNACSSDTECISPPNTAAIARCTGGFCKTDFAPIFSLVIQVPNINASAPGVLFALSPNLIAARREKKLTIPCAGEVNTCLPIPLQDGVRGELQTSAEVLPASISFQPRWANVGDLTAVPSRQRGIPLPEVEGSPIVLPLQTNVGVGGSVPVGFQAFLQGTSDDNSVPNKDGIVSYRLRMMPTPPFDAIYPPVGFDSARVVTPYATVEDLTKYGPVDVISLSLDAATKYSLLFKLLPGAASFGGYHASIVSWPGGERVSNIITLAGRDGESHDFLTQNSDSAETNEALIVEPPPNSLALPTIEIAAINAGSASYQFTNVSFPKLYSPVVVKGQATMLDPTGQVLPAESDILFDAPGTVLANDPQPSVYNLNYRAYVTTDPVGNYAVLLPPGTYTVWITPHNPALARTKTTATVGTAEAVLEGRSFVVNPKAHLTGRVITMDGRPLSNATIEAEPSADRYAIPRDENLHTTALAWPRESSTLTDSSGRFDLLADPGEIDVTVLPTSGSHFPWTTSRRTVAETDIALDDIVVPWPLAVSWQLVDDGGAPIPLALIFAYMQPDSMSAMRLVGEVMTDTTGHFQLDLPH